MRYAISLLLFLPLFAARLETARLAPSASVWFEPNAGQVKGRTEFVGRTRGAYLYMTGREVVYAMAPAKIERGAAMRQVRMEFAGAALRSVGTGEEATGGFSNYFVGKTDKEWFTGVPHYGRLRYREVYPGIDVVYYGANGAIEFDFIVKPGADVSQIGMRFHGATSLAVGEDVVVKKDGAEMRVRRPRVLHGGIEIPSWYEMENGVVKIRIAEIDSAAALTIDPILDFSTYIGGPGSELFSKMELAPDGNPILAGSTQSPASPALDPFQQPSVVSAAPIILKMSSDGRRIIFYTILGQNGWDFANALAIGKDGAITTGGNTQSSNFPLKNAFQNEFKAVLVNGFVTRISADGRSVIYSSYLGGSVSDNVFGIALDDVGNAYFAGGTQSKDFPLLKPLQANAAGGFLTRISPDGKILFSTYFGSSATGGFETVKWRPDGVLVLTGQTWGEDLPLKNPIQSTVTPRPGWTHPYLAMITDDGSAVRYSSYIGGSAVGFARALAIDKRGNIYIAGFANFSGFPVKNALFTEAEGFHGFLTVFDPTGQERLYSTLVPGAWECYGIALDADGGIVVVGAARSSDFPLRDSLQPFRGGGVVGTDGFVMKFSADGRTLHFSTLMGGTNGEFFRGVAVGSERSIYVSGYTYSTDFPVKNAYQPQSGGGSDAAFYRLTDNSVLPTSAAPFSVSPSRLTFRFTQGEAPPAALPITIGGLTGQVFAASNVPWLRVTPSGLGVSGTMSFSVDPSALPPGVHQGSVRLTPTSGAAATVDVTFTVLAAAPLLLAVEPATVPVGTDDTEITLRGAGFTNRTTVQLQTVPWQLTPVRLVDATTLRFTLPKTYFSAEYNHSITVQNPDSAFSKPVSLAVGRPAPAIAPKGIVSAASYAGDVISPGEILTIFGENFEQGMRVNFDGLLATPLYVTPTQMSVVAPAGLTGAREANVIVEKNFDWRSVPVRIPVWPARPGLFTANGSGKGLAAALNEDGSVNAAENPAAKGSIVVLWGTGGGVENLPVKVFVDGMECEVLYAGGKDGLWQVNVRVPEFAVKGEVIWRVGERESVEGVSIALRD